MSVPAAVVLAASLAAHDHTAIVGYRVYRTSAIAAGPFHRSDDVVLSIIFNGEHLKGLRILKDVVDGHTADAPSQQALGKQLSDPSSRPFAVPFDARHFKDYRYHIEGRRVFFVSLKRDAQHGDGFFDLGRSGDVTLMQYAPDVLPKYATAGTVREERAEVLPHFWATTRSVESYDGRYMIFHGHGEFTTIDMGFRRFQTVAQAAAWLQAERL